MAHFNAKEALMKLLGNYRAEALGHNRRIIKYIGKARRSFAQRLSSGHGIKIELVDGQPRHVQMYLGTIID